MKLKNNDERKAWLRSYRDWGVWYEDDCIGATYYHYIFDNGAELIVDEYVFPKTAYLEERTEGFYHLVGGPKDTKGKWAYHPIYDPFPDSEMFLVEFLKALGKDVEL